MRIHWKIQPVHCGDIDLLCSDCRSKMSADKASNLREILDLQTKKICVCLVCRQITSADKKLSAEQIYFFCRQDIIVSCYKRLQDVTAILNLISFYGVNELVHKFLMKKFKT